MYTLDLARLNAAERRLADVAHETGGFGVEALFVDQQDRSIPPGIPDALYIDRGDPYVHTTLYDVAEDLLLEIAWGDWLETAEAGRRADR